MIHWREGLGRRWLVMVYSDPYTVAEWQHAISEVIRHPLWESRRRLLVDRRHCNAPSTDFIRQIEQWLREHPHGFHGSRVAVVVKDEVGYGMTRMHEILTDVDALPLELRGFRKWEEAEQWLSEA